MDNLNELTGVEQAPAVAGRDERGRFLKGFSGNPSGRPAGVEAMIREMTNDGRDVLDVLTGYALGDPVRARCETVPAREQRQAAQWLAERLWGKTPSVLGVVAGGEVSLNLTPEDRRTLYRYVLVGTGLDEGETDDAEE